MTFTFDVMDAYYNAPEDEEVYVDPPKPYLQPLEDAGRETDIKWRLWKQLPGRRRAGQAWTDHLAAFILEIGGEQCEGADRTRVVWGKGG